MCTQEYCSTLCTQATGIVTVREQGREPVDNTQLHVTPRSGPGPNVCLVRDRYYILPVVMRP